MKLTLSNTGENAIKMMGRDGTFENDLTETMIEPGQSIEVELPGAATLVLREMGLPLMDYDYDATNAGGGGE